MNGTDTPQVNDQADMAGTSMDDLSGAKDPAADGSDKNVEADATDESKPADELDEAQKDAADRREEEGGYQ